MASYQVELKDSAQRELRRLPKPEIIRLSKAIDSLADNPFPLQSKKLFGLTNAYRLRVGNYQVVYAVDGQAFLVTVIRIRHRKDAYRNFR